MRVFKPDWGEIHQNLSMGPVTPFLRFLSYLYGTAVRIRTLSYWGGIKKEKTLPGTVISIGNLTTGGTGKTPAVIALATWMKDEGHRVAVLSRGHGRNSRKKVLEVSNDHQVLGTAGNSGDEPYLIAKRLNGVPVIVSKHRYSAGMFAHENFGSNVFILDDGFQHIGLKRDLNVALIDAEKPFGNGFLLPRGPLREPIEGLKRANAFIITRFKESGEGKKTAQFLRTKFKKIPIFYADHHPLELVFETAGKVYEPSFLKGKPVVGFAGIAHPEAFEGTLHLLQAKLLFFKRFGDHYTYSKKDVMDLIETKNRLGAQYLITTEKDWAKIFHLANSYPEIAFLRIHFSLKSEEDMFFKMVDQVINQKLISVE